MKAIWSGAINFGLVNIPVKMYSATEDRNLDFDMLDSRDNERVRYQRVNEKTGKEVPWGKIVKGYKGEEDDYVILTDKDFEQASARKSKTIDIEEFVPQEEVAEILYKTPYYLEPDKGGSDAYALLRDALIESKKAGVASFVMRSKENLALLVGFEDVILLHVIRFANEIREHSELELPSKKAGKKELKMALDLIDQYSSDFVLDKYEDDYVDKLLEIIENKRAGTKPKLHRLKPEPATGAKDLMKKLQESLKMKKAS